MYCTIVSFILDGKRDGMHCTVGFRIAKSTRLSRVHTAHTYTLYSIRAVMHMVGLCAGGGVGQIDNTRHH